MFKTTKLLSGLHDESGDSANLTHKLDSLLEVKKVLDADIANANTILGMGGWLPDSVKVIRYKK